MDELSVGAARSFLVLALCALGILLVPARANAFFDTLMVTPSVPVAGQTYRFSVRVGGCHVVTSAVPLEYQVVDGTVRLTIDVSDDNDASFGVGQCSWPAHTAFFDLPGLPAGAYRFELWRRTSREPIVPLRFVSAIDITVAAGAPAPTAVPTGGPFGWLMLGLWFLMAGAFAERRLRHASTS